MAINDYDEMHGQRVEVETPSRWRMSADTVDRLAILAACLLSTIVMYWGGWRSGYDAGRKACHHGPTVGAVFQPDGPESFTLTSAPAAGSIVCECISEAGMRARAKQAKP